MISSNGYNDDRAREDVEFFVVSASLKGEELEILAASPSFLWRRKD